MTSLSAYMLKVPKVSDPTLEQGRPRLLIY